MILLPVVGVEIIISFLFFYVVCRQEIFQIILTNHPEAIYMYIDLNGNNMSTIPETIQKAYTAFSLRFAQKKAAHCQNKAEEEEKAKNKADEEKYSAGKVEELE